MRDLCEAHRREVLEVVHAEVDDVEALDLLGGRFRRQDLAAMRGAGDASGLVDAEGEIVAIGGLSLSTVEADADADLCVVRPWVRGHRLLCLHTGSRGVPRGREREEKPVTLRAHFGRAVRSEGVADDRPMRLEQVEEPGAELREQLRGALDVGEAERDVAPR
jgi:hypothetical protein